MLDRLRMVEWLLFAAILLALIGWIAPAQIPVVIYKLALVTLFAHVGYWIVRRMDMQPGQRDPLSASIVMAAVILAGALAL